MASSRSGGSVSWFENDGTPTEGEWTGDLIASGLDYAVGVGIADLDGDGDLDVASAAFVQDLVTIWLSDASPGDGGWQRIDVATGFNGAHEVAVSDLDRDGKLDLAAAKTGMVRWWSNGGGQLALPTTDAVVTATPNAGTADVLLLDIDGAHRGRSGDAFAELATLELGFDDGVGNPFAGSQLDALVDPARLYLDDGDGIFEPGTDDASFLSLGSPFDLQLGVLELTMVDGDPSVQVGVGADVTWWVAVDVAAAAVVATPAALRVTHVTDPSSIVSPSTGEMSTTDLPLTLEAGANVSSSLVDINDPPTLDSPIVEDVTRAAYSYDIAGF